MGSTVDKQAAFLELPIVNEVLIYVDGLKKSFYSRGLPNRVNPTTEISSSKSNLIVSCLDELFYEEALDNLLLFVNEKHRPPSYIIRRLIKQLFFNGHLNRQRDSSFNISEQIRQKGILALEHVLKLHPKVLFEAITQIDINSQDASAHSEQEEFTCLDEWLQLDFSRKKGLYFTKLLCHVLENDLCHCLQCPESCQNDFLPFLKNSLGSWIFRRFLRRGENSFVVDPLVITLVTSCSIYSENPEVAYYAGKLLCNCCILVHWKILPASNFYNNLTILLNKLEGPILHSLFQGVYLNSCSLGIIEEIVYMEFLLPRQPTSISINDKSNLLHQYIIPMLLKKLKEPITKRTEQLFIYVVIFTSCLLNIQSIFENTNDSEIWLGLYNWVCEAKILFDERSFPSWMQDEITAIEMAIHGSQVLNPI